ncbi:uncharacterized protein K02A2.6-like [Myzus persicae]|uniref:uncharacterized protein K02A2.6-like n=1 Tax=Myzus persicae TaxID=13164 RepID=UPI000B92FBB6|nr:uncharacterized protein K02A2.6-like [Myzus persicae]
MSLEFNRPGGLCLEGNISENFKIFKQEILIYFKATETDKKDTGVQVARLLNLLGHDGLKLYNTIKKEDPETVDTILKALEIYCIPKTNEIIEHFNFFNRKQGEGEQFDIWYTDLKKLIKGCNFGDAEDKMLRTQIVLGVFDKETQTRLLRDDVGLVKIVAYCQSIERAESNRRMLSSTKEVDKVVHGVGFKSKWGTEDIEKRNNSKQSQWKRNNANDHQTETTEDKGKMGSQINCNRCGLRHMYRECPAYGKNCRNCSGFNHFAIMCKKKKQVYEKNIKKKAQEIRVESKDEEDSVFSVQSIHTVCSIKNEWCKVFKVNGKEVNFKLDSGAEVNTLSERDCKKLNLMKLIKKSNIVLEVYGGFKMKPTGEVKAILTLGDQKIETEFVVIDKIYDSKSIIGLPMLKKFKLLKNVNVIDKSRNESDINYFIENNRDIFEGVGCFPDVCKLTMKEGVTPKASVARRVPIKIKDKLKLKLEELVEKEIIAPADEPSEWVNNLVIVQKPDLSLRICLDPQELNKSLVRDQFLVPTLEEITPKLIGRKYYSVLDLKDGYYHIKLDDRSSKYCTFSTPFGNYRFLRLAFGLSVAPELFMKQNEKYFGDIEGVTIYFDDI